MYPFNFAQYARGWTQVWHEKIKSTEEEMSKHVFEFDFTRFGCNEEAVKDYTKELLSRLWFHFAATGQVTANEWTVRNPQPKGVRVSVGQRVRARTITTETLTVAPKQDDFTIRVWDESGHKWGWTIQNFTTLDGAPVLGYEDDA